jgi:hypothetical protein
MAILVDLGDPPLKPIQEVVLASDVRLTAVVQSTGYGLIRRGCGALLRRLGCSNVLVGVGSCRRLRVGVTLQLGAVLPFLGLTSGGGVERGDH